MVPLYAARVQDGVPVATEPRVRLGTPARRGASVSRRKPIFYARRNIGQRKAAFYDLVAHQLMHLSLAINPLVFLAESNFRFHRYRTPMPASTHLGIGACNTASAVGEGSFGR